MQFLQMAQKVRQLVGMQGTGPSSVTATGYEGLFVSLVQDAYNDIQNLRKKWKWLRDSKNFFLAAGTTTYAIATIFPPGHRFKRWYDHTFYIEVDSKKHQLTYVDYDSFIYRHINDTENTVPTEFTIRPQDSALIFPLPDDMYTVYCDYHKTNQTLTLSTDVPEMPVDYHMAIVYEAVNRYALSVAIPHVYQQYSQLHASLLGDLLRDQLPQEKFKVRGIA